MFFHKKIYFFLLFFVYSFLSQKTIEEASIFIILTKNVLFEIRKKCFCTKRNHFCFVKKFCYLKNKIPYLYKTVDIKKIGNGSTGTILSIEEGNFSIATKIYIENEKSCFVFKKNKLPLEVYIMRQLNHPNIISYISYFKLEDVIFIFMEKAEKSLDNILFGKQRNPLSRLKAARYMLDILNAVEYLLKEKKIIHGDIKPKNIVIVKNISKRIVKLIDFEYSTFIDKNENTVALKKTNNLFHAPEHSTKIPFNAEKAEIFSLGYLYNIIRTTRRLEKNIYFTENQILENDEKDLINKMLNKEPDKRPSLKQIKKEILNIIKKK